MAQGRAYSIIGRLFVKLCCKEQRIRRLSPTVVILQSPDHHAWTVIVIQHDIGYHTIAASLLLEVCIGSIGDTHVEFGDDTLQTGLFKTTDSLVEAQTIYVTDGEVTLQADTVDWNTGLFHAYSEIIECCRLSLTLELHTVVVQIQLGIGICLMCIDKGGINVVIANSLLPYAVFLYLIPLGISAHRRLVIVQTFVHHVPLVYLAFIMPHHIGDMVLHNSEGLLARPVLIIGLAAIGGDPRRRLLVPNEAVAAHRHLLISGESDNLLSVAGKTKSAILASVGLRFHIVFGHKHVELKTDGLSLGQA